MKLFLSLAAIILLSSSYSGCNSKDSSNGVYKARLQIKALCMNYTLQLVQGNIDTSLIASRWTDETSHVTYNNVFGLGNPCTFPDSIKQGDEFYFRIDTGAQKQCMVCMAYYPTPPKKLFIKVVNK
jgi:hypothetical protein